MAVFIVHWPCLLTTKLSCLQKNKWGQATVNARNHFRTLLTYALSNNEFCGLIRVQITVQRRVEMKLCKVSMRYSTTSEFYLNSTSSLQWVTFLLHLIILNSIFFICIGLSLYLCDIKFLFSIWPSQSPCNKVQRRWVFLEQNLSRLGCLEFMNPPYFWFWVAFKSCTMHQSPITLPERIYNSHYSNGVLAMFTS